MSAMSYVPKFDRSHCCDCSAPTAMTPKGRKAKRCAACTQMLRGPKTHRRKHGEGWVERSCAQCHTKFSRLERGSTDRVRYCSTACASAAVTLGNKNKGRLRWGRGAKHVYSCRACGAQFYRKPGAGSGGFKRTPIHCSRSCRYIGLRLRSIDSAPSPHLKTRRDRARQSGRVTPLAILERDGWKCRICGCDTPKRLRGTTDSRAPECDHVIPLCHGGMSTAENMQCLCRLCNQLKGSSVVVDIEAIRLRRRREAQAHPSTGTIDDVVASLSAGAMGGDGGDSSSSVPCCR